MTSIALLIAAALLLPGLALAQAPAAPAGPQPAAPTAPAKAPPAPAPIPLSELPTRAESVSAQLRDVEADLDSNPTTTAIRDGLAPMTRDVDARVRETARVLASRPSLEVLRSLETGWQKVAGSLGAWQRELTARATELDRRLAHLNEHHTTGQDTRAAARKAATPGDLVRRIESILAEIRQTRIAVEARRANVWMLQGRVAEVDARVVEALDSIKQAREAAVDRLLVQDVPPIWDPRLQSPEEPALVKAGEASLTVQLEALRAYAERRADRFLLHGFIALAIVGGLYWTRRRLPPRLASDPDLAPAAVVFEHPAATAIVASTTLAAWIYPEAPRLLHATLGAIALVPAVIIVRRLIHPGLLPVLYALMAFYLVDRLRAVAAPFPLLWRVLFLGEMLAGLVFLAWFARRQRRPAAAAVQAGRLRTVIRMAVRVAALMFAAAFLANTVGYAALGEVLGHGLLGSAYVGMFLYAALGIYEAVLVLVLPLVPLRLVRYNQSAVRRRLMVPVQWLMAIGWAAYALELLTIRRPLVSRLHALLTATLSVGWISVSLVNVVAFVVTVWAAFLLSRFLRFVLEEEVYSRVDLPRGLPYAISRMLQYATVLLGFFLGVAALGFDLTKMTIVAGAVGVGVGFGLQNVINNFVSGLILLFERPLKVGDIIQVGDAAGVVDRIGIRASVIRTRSGSEIIVPNGKLLDDRVTNWTRSSHQRAVELAVSATGGADPRKLVEILTAVARAHPLVSESPPPEALVVGFAAGAINFELRAWTAHVEDWVRIRSDLAMGVSAAFAEQKIAMP